MTSKALVLLIAAAAILPSHTAAQTVAAGIRTAIEKAGNTDCDRERLEILVDLQKQPHEKPFADDLAKLIKEIRQWLELSRLNYFGGTVRNKMDYDFGLSDNSPLEPLTWLYRARMITWYALESGNIGRHPDRQAPFLAGARRLFENYRQAFPKNRIAAMYLGSPIRAPKTYEAPANAPRWAAAQREGLERLTDIIEWWIDNRMQPDGQYGGGWGDDCEMWRWWVPVLIAFDNPKITAAQQRFSEAMMNQPHMKGGYTSRMTDVEHTAEDSADVITPMMHLDPDNPAWKQRALRLAELMDTLWTGRNERGFLQFKSTYFTVDKVDANPQRACDTVYHPRAVQPALLYWQRTGDADLTRLFSAWMDTWVDATARAERGKPAGIIPSAIHWPDGRIGGLADEWWDPKNHGESTLYLWPSAMGLMTDTLVLTWHMTADEKYLAPLRSMAAIQLKYLKTPPASTPARGTEAWCARNMDAITQAITRYTFLTGSSEFDDLLARRTTTYMQYRNRGRIEQLADAFEQTAEALRINFESYTSEVRYTDRVLYFPRIFGPDGIVPGTTTPARSPNTGLLYATATGDPGSALYFPLNAVRWLTPSRNIAALVTDSGTTHFTANLYNFDTKERPMAAELYLLSKGTYNVALTPDDSPNPLATQTLTITAARTPIRFKLPSQRPCTLKITRQEP
ncbi:MAG: hypothetical protein IH624_19605 [Phycisphaerae bacterium]|nr:hypothetical protein [Phycisphaerae bacterium]